MAVLWLSPGIAPVDEGQLQLRSLDGASRFPRKTRKFEISTRENPKIQEFGKTWGKPWKRKGKKENLENPLRFHFSPGNFVEHDPRPFRHQGAGGGVEIATAGIWRITQTHRVRLPGGSKIRCCFLYLGKWYVFWVFLWCIWNIV